ncbi:transcription elongation factor A N-terminal and central domain-containing protein isoform 1-T2 [Menidia menidia]
MWKEQMKRQLHLEGNSGHVLLHKHVQDGCTHTDASCIGRKKLKTVKEISVIDPLSAGDMDAKEIVHCALQIQKFTADRSTGNIMALLTDLHQSQVTAEQLETTDIVRVLYRLLRSRPDNDMKKMVKSLLSKWKKQYSKDGQGVKYADGGEDSVPISKEEREEGDSTSERGQPCDSRAGGTTQQTGLCGGPGPQGPVSPAERTPLRSDPVRTRCSQLLLGALSAEPPDEAKASRLAEDMEQHIHQLHAASRVKYKACIRSKVANLRNPQNAHLRGGLLGGSLSPEAFARMSAEEMASAQLRQLREEYSSRGLSQRQLPRGVEGTRTNKIRCRNCGGSDCRVTQVSRGVLFLPAWVRQGGPDQDAMTFVTCSGCGQQWYHSGWNCL